MGERDAVSVLLPTVEWTPACGQVVDQLRPGDELLILCDREDDPVAARDVPAGTEVIVAGDPEGCSGKANAMARGMERAANDRFVWTDGDFERDDGWLDRLVGEGDEHGPATAIPFFYGGGFWAIVEPWAAVFSTLLFYLGVGSWGGNAWGGGATFTREELDVSADQLADELRQVLSDDALLSRHLGDVHPVQSMVTPVEVPGDLSTAYNRLVRFTRLTHVHEGIRVEFVASLALAVLAVLFPVHVAVASTLATASTFLLVGVRRPTFLLSYPGLFLLPWANLAGIAVSEFEWAGRRYRLAGLYDVDVLAE